LIYKKAGENYPVLAFVYTNMHEGYWLLAKYWLPVLILRVKENYGMLFLKEVLPGRQIIKSTG
jgi:hypothetical protein